MINYGTVKKTSDIVRSSSDLVQAASSAYVAYEALLQCNADVAEASVIIDNIRLATESIAANPTSLAIFNEGGALESFIGSAEMASAEKATAALEGKFAEALKNFWAKVKEWFARLYDWIRKIFFSLEGELKHLEGMVNAKNDGKFNKDYKFEDPFITKQVLTATFDAGLKMQPVVEKILKTADKIDIGKITPILMESAKTDKPVDDAKLMEACGLKEEDLVKLEQEFNEASKGAAAAAKGTVDDLENETVPFEAFKKVLRTGTAEELGFKTAADVREVVTKYIASVRGAQKLIPLISNANKKMGQLADAFSGATDSFSGVDNVGVRDFLKLYKTFNGLIDKLLNKYYMKWLRWELMFVTRLVRKLYSK